MSVLHIDEDRLDREWARQADLFHDAALKLADARLALEEAEAEFALVEAEQDREVRLHPQTFGLEKVTDKAVANAVVRSTPYGAAQKQVIERKHAADVLKALVDALSHKKAALEYLTRLRLSDFYADPRNLGPREEREAAAELRREAAFVPRRSRS